MNKPMPCAAAGSQREPLIEDMNLRGFFREDAPLLHPNCDCGHSASAASEDRRDQW
jgi:hypothetical protein